MSEQDFPPRLVDRKNLVIEFQIEEIDKELDVLNKQVKELTDRKYKLICTVVKTCPHEYIVVTANNGQYPWKDTDVACCINCGVSVVGNGCGPFESGVLSFKDSRIISLRPEEKIPTKVYISLEHMDALRFPRRFTKKRLAELLESTLWTVDEVMEKDVINYWVLRELYDTHNDWYYDQIGDVYG